MAKILLVWEFGSGMGHLMTLRPIGEAFVRRGHEVTAAVRNLAKAKELFEGTGITTIAIPSRAYPEPPPFPRTCGMPQVLGNIGFADENHLAGQLAAWDELISSVKPDLVVADYAPTVLLALRGVAIRRVNVGVGFSCPPNVSPMPYWGTSKEAHLGDQIIKDEKRVLESINRVLQRLAKPALQRMSQIFTDVDETILATYREFDHYGPREGVRYWGHWNLGAGELPDWPKAQGAKVFAYLKPFSGLEGLLRILVEARLPTIMLAADIPQELQRRYVSPTLHWESRALDMAQVAAQCDLAILNAGHGTTLTMLTAGKPCLLIPLFIEQLVTAKKAAELGAARLVSKTDVGQIAEGLRDLLDLPKYTSSAGAFASRYASSPPGKQIPEIVSRLERLIPSAAI